MNASGKSLLIFLFCLIAFWSLCWALYWLKNRKNILINLKKNSTLFDVRQALLKNDRTKAIELYISIFKTDRTTAEKSIQELEKSLPQKS